MRAVIQRVRQAEVRTPEGVVASIEQGLVTLLDVSKDDHVEIAEKVIRKIIELRIFSDSNGKMNLSLKDIRGAHLIVSQFTLLADCTQGRRPSFLNAESPEKAKLIYEKAISLSQEMGISTQGGVFQADMQISLVNDGPATFVVDA